MDGSSANAPVKKNRCWQTTTVYHSGDLGDIIYSLLWCWSELVSIDLWLGPDPRWTLRRQMDRATFDFLAPLFKFQSWIQSVKFFDRPPLGAICLNDFRRTWFSNRRSTNLFEAYAEHFHSKPLPENVAWLGVDPAPIPNLPVVISRSARYRNTRFPWWYIHNKYHGRLAFVGLREEFDEWRFHFGGGVTYWPVKDALDLARVIAGARLFIGNQSFPMALALALNVPLIQEVSPNNSDCILKRPNAIYYREGGLSLPFT